MSYPTNDFEISAVECSIKSEFPEFTEIKFFEIDVSVGFSGKVLIEGFEFYINQDCFIISKTFEEVMNSIKSDLRNTISTFKRIISCGEASEVDLACVILHIGAYDNYIDFCMSEDEAICNAREWLDHSDNNALIAIGHIYQQYVKGDIDEEIPF